MKHLPLVVLVLLLAACQQNPTPTAAPQATAAPTTQATAETAAIVNTPTTAALAPPETPTSTPTAVPTETPEPTFTPTATPVPPKELTVCMASLPTDVYLYGDQTLQATAVRHAIYESLLTTLDFGYQPRALAELPTLENGGLRLETVEATLGTRVVNSAGNIITLRLEDSVVNSAGEVVRFTGGSVEMTQMVVEYTFQPLVWSDGTAVTADDSVFSYEIAADPFTLSDKQLVNQTATYEAIDELTVRWTGIPGHRASRYLHYVWPPLPRHQLGEITPLRLPEEPSAARTPLSTGAFVISSWDEAQMVLEPNPHYYRSAEALPHLDRLTFTAVGTAADPLALIAAGQCDVITQELIPLSAPGLAEAADQGANLHVTDGVIWEHIALGINSYGRPATLRPDWFQDSRVRTALLQCTDRATMLANATHGLATLTDNYVPATHPLAAGLPSAPPFDPTAANALLDEVGYVDKNDDGWRDDIETNATFSITVRTTPGEVRETVAAQFAADLAACGVQVTLVVEPTPKFFADSLEGTIFPRNYDAALFGWLVGVDPVCEHYQSQEISGPTEERFAGWRGANVTGYFNPAFDTACREARSAFYGTAEYTAAHTAALTTFATDWPSIPLFARPKLLLTGSAVQNALPNPSQPSELWNVAEWAVEE
ncbi:MAG: ABC transporter substrate-binding protein [Chloroflexi bacterium]|nr:ABC transporter substrate-binding protein [Chloroflexota bacterium]